MVGLSRGVGSRICQINAYERDLINEHDLAVYIFGNFKHCITESKPKLFEGIEIPIVVTGAPEIASDGVQNADVYVGNLGRVAHRMRKGDEMHAMDQMVAEVGKILDKLREDIGKDQQSVMPPRVKKEIEDQVPEIKQVLSPLPITLRLKGLKVKLDYDEFHEKIGEVSFVEGIKLKDIADIRRSNMKNFILVDIRPKSETGYVI